MGYRRTFADDAVHLDPADRETVDMKSRLETQFPPGYSVQDALQDVIRPGGVWRSHSPDAAPAWVASDDPTLALILSRLYGCEQRDPVPAGERGEFAHRFPGSEG